MRKSLFIVITFLPILAQAQTSKVFDNLSMKSKILNMDRKYAIYLPPDYETSQRRYPVLYLLHGGGDDDFLYEGNSLIHISMRKHNIPHEFRIRDGKHDWTYWRHSLYDVLNFVSIGFHQGTD